MDKFPVYLLRQLLNCMQDGLSIRVTAQKLGISKSSVSFLSQTALSHGGGAKVAELIQLPDTQLLETFYPPTTKAYQEPDWVEVHKKAGPSECHAQIAVRRLQVTSRQTRINLHFLLSPLRRVAASQRPWRTQRQRPSHPR